MAEGIESPEGNLKPAPTPEQLEAKRRAIANQQAAQVMARVADFAKSALAGILVNPAQWVQITKSMGCGPDFFAQHAWDIGIAMEDRGQEIFKAILHDRLNPPKKEDPSDGKEKAEVGTQAGGSDRPAGVGDDPGRSSIIIPS